MAISMVGWKVITLLSKSGGWISIIWVQFSCVALKSPSYPFLSVGKWSFDLDCAMVWADGDSSVLWLGYCVTAGAHYSETTPQYG